MELPKGLILRTKLTTNLDGIEKLSPKKRAALESKYQGFLSRMQLYALKRGLPFEMIEQFLSRERMSPLERHLHLMGSEPKISLIDPVRQISFIHWDCLQDLDLRSIKPTLDILRFLGIAMEGCAGTFKSFRFQYCDRDSTSLSPDHAHAGARLLQTLRGKITDTLEIDRFVLTLPEEADAFIKLLTTPGIRSLILTKFFTYTQTLAQRMMLSKMFIEALTNMKTLEEVRILFKDTPNRAMLDVILSFDRMPNLRKFDISHNHIGWILGEDSGVSGVKDFMRLADCIREAVALEELDLSYNDLFVDDHEEFKKRVKDALDEREARGLKYYIDGNGIIDLKDNLKDAATQTDLEDFTLTVSPAMEEAAFREETPPSEMGDTPDDSELLETPHPVRMETAPELLDTPVRVRIETSVSVKDKIKKRNRRSASSSKARLQLLKRLKGVI